MVSIWKLRHFLFGTHFIVLRYGWSDMVRAVRWTPAGRPHVKCCGDFIWLDDSSREKWAALTFDKKEFVERIKSNAAHLRVVK